MFGGYDTQAIRKPSGEGSNAVGDKEGIVWMPVADSKTWSLKVNDFRVGSGVGNSISSKSYKAIIDSGSTQILLPSDLWK